MVLRCGKISYSWVEVIWILSYLGWSLLVSKSLWQYDWMSKDVSQWSPDGLESRYILIGPCLVGMTCLYERYIQYIFYDYPHGDTPRYTDRHDAYDWLRVYPWRFHLPFWLQHVLVYDIVPRQPLPSFSSRNLGVICAFPSKRYVFDELWSNLLDNSIQIMGKVVPFK